MKPYIIPLISALVLGSGTALADPIYDISQLVKKGKKEEALQQIEEYLSKQPKEAWGRNITQMRFLRGNLLAEQNRTSEAIKVFQKLSLDYPDLPEPYNNLAVLYAAQGRMEDARDALEHALRTDATYATAFRNLNEVYARLATQAYDHTLQASKGGQPAPALIKELCDNYGRLANQSVGRRQQNGGDINLVQDIPKNRASAGSPPSKIDIDEMAVADNQTESALPPAFVNPGVNPAPQLPSVVVADKTKGEIKTTKKAPPSQSSAIANSNASAVSSPATPSKPEPEAKQEPAATAGEDKIILAAVKDWAGAWSGKNLGRYLGAYSKDFRAPNGQSRNDWSKLRRERISKPKSIRVTIDAPSVNVIDASHATVSFRQGYRSDDLQTSTRKMLLMVKQGGRWLIQEERVGG